MKIAIPLAAGQLTPHFGHCEEFAMLEVDEASKQIINQTRQTPPPHEPGVLPRWLYEQGVDLVIAGGMGSRAQQLFAQNSIQVVVGIETGDPEQIVTAFLNGILETGVNACDH